MEKTKIKLTDNNAKINLSAPKQMEATDRPARYTASNGRDVIDFIREQRGKTACTEFILGNIIKYSARAGKKGSVDEDFGKIQVYANRLVEENKEED